MSTNHSHLHAVLLAEPEVAYALRSPLAAAGTECIICESWEETSASLKRLNVDLLVIDLDALMEQGLRAWLMARSALASIGIPTVAVYKSLPAADAESFVRHASIGRLCTWPQPSRELANALNDIVPGCAAASGDHHTDAEYSAPAVRAWVGWFEPTEVGGTSMTPRVTITMPSLSQGDTAKLPLPRLLHLLSVQRRKGVLTISHGEQSARIGVSNGRLVDLEDPRNFARVTAAFSWKSGQFLFDECTDVGGESVSTSTFVLQSLLEQCQFNELARILAGHSAHIASPTTLFSLHAHESQSVLAARRILAQFDGQTTIESIIKTGQNGVSDILVAIAFGLVTDDIVLTDGAVEPPLGLSYRMRDISNHESRPSLPAVDQKRRAQSTIGRISRLDSEGQRLIQKLKALRDSLGKADPYVTLGLTPGCGRRAVQAAYFRLMGELTLPRHLASEEPLVRMAATLTGTTMTEIYEIVWTREHDDAASNLGQYGAAASA